VLGLALAFTLALALALALHLVHPLAHPLAPLSRPHPHPSLGLARYDALVCTPLRLVSLIEKGGLSLHTVSLLVMDEADKLLELGFLEQAQTKGCSPIAREVAAPST